MSAVESPLAPTVDGIRRVFCCHRAILSGEHPPNSIEAVRECLEAGVPRLEFDLWVLSDGSQVLFHDDDLDEETDAHGPIASRTRASLADVRYRGGHALTFLDEVIEAARGSKTLIQVDLKGFEVTPRGALDGLARVLEPVASHTIVGSQAHWNLRPLAEAGLAIAFDTTLQWHASGWDWGGLGPGRVGRHGLWDDAPIASVDGITVEDYVAARVDDLAGMLPAVEWMVDYRTLFHLQDLGCSLGAELQRRGIALAAWTLKDEGRETSSLKLERLFSLGAETVISEAAATVATYLA